MTVELYRTIQNNKRALARLIHFHRNHKLVAQDPSWRFDHKTMPKLRLTLEDNLANALVKTYYEIRENTNERRHQLAKVYTTTFYEKHKERSWLAADRVMGKVRPSLGVTYTWITDQRYADYTHDMDVKRMSKNIQLTLSISWRHAVYEKLYNNDPILDIPGFVLSATYIGKQYEVIEVFKIKYLRFEPDSTKAVETYCAKVNGSCFLNTNIAKALSAARTALADAATKAILEGFNASDH